MTQQNRSLKPWLDQEPGPVVRPYAMTRGRTRPVSGQFDLISLIAATCSTLPADARLGPEHATILSLCQRPLSVAEVAAHLNLPLGTVRVFLGDLLANGLILARQPTSVADKPGERVLLAVIDGLRAL